MNEQTVRLVERVMAVMLVFVCVSVAVLWHREALARASAEAYAKAQDQVVEQSKATVQQRAQDQAKQDARYTQEINGLHTQMDALAAMQRYVPSTQGQVAQLKPEQVPAEMKKDLPDAPGYALMTQQGALDLGKAVLQGEKCKSDLLACVADKQDQAVQIEALDKKSKALDTALKGGTTAHRAGRWALLAGCSAAGAAGGEKAGKTKGAAIGALVSFAACSLAVK